MRRTALLLVPFLALAACSSDSGGSDAAAPQRDLRVEGSQAPRQGQQPKDALALAREVIRTGSITVRVADLDAARGHAVTLAENAGGYLEAEQGRLETGTVLTLRVPPAKFTATADAAAKLGTVLERSVATEDVTGDVADVKGRLAAARASVDRVRKLLGDATSLSEITTIEGELNERESELEALESRLRALRDKTTFAKLAVDLRRAAPPAAEPKTDDTPTSFADGLSMGWSGFVAVGTVLLVILGVLLPFAAAAAAVIVPLVVLLRRRRPRAHA